MHEITGTVRLSSKQHLELGSSRPNRDFDDHVHCWCCFRYHQEHCHCVCWRHGYLDPIGLLFESGDVRCLLMKRSKKILLDEIC